MIVGQYVKTFAEASHALPNGMHLDADYPFMLPPIQKIEHGEVTIRGRYEKTATFTIEKTRDGREFGYIEQSSSFEQIFRREPTRFRMDPFKDEKTPACGGQGALEL